MVAIKSSPNHENLIRVFARVYPKDLEQLIRLQELHCKKIKIESGKYIFDGVEDLLINWHLVENSIDVNFFPDEEDNLRNSFSATKGYIACEVVAHPSSPKSEIVAANTLAFVKKSTSSLRLLFYSFVVILGISTWMIFGFGGLIYSDLHNFNPAAKVVLVVVGFVSVSFAGRITDFVLPALSKTEKNNASVFIRYLIFPLFVLVLGSIIVSLLI